MADATKAGSSPTADLTKSILLVLLWAPEIEQRVLSNASAVARPMPAEPPAMTTTSAVPTQRPAATRQTALPTSSATSSAPRLSFHLDLHEPRLDAATAEHVAVGQDIQLGQTLIFGIRAHP
jgi:uncharacterized membrane protein